jgi:hypothetical protein
VDEFWFVDTGYFGRQSPDRTPSLLRGAEWRLLEAVTLLPDLPESAWNTDWATGCQPLYIRRETYRNYPTGVTITVNRHRRRGPSALRKEITSLDVFFYRGDSDDGGSGTNWLSAAPRWFRHHRRPLFYEVLDKLVDGGLVVTDGSMGDDYANNPYRGLRQVKAACTCGPEIVAQVAPFTDLRGNRFECVGFAGQRYGPTLIWQVTKPLAAA